MGVKFFYLVALSFTTLCISCGSSVENDRLSETSSEKSEIKSVTSQEVMPEGEINKSLLKRFIVPTPDEIGRQLALESLGNENPYYLSKSPPQQQYQQEDRKHANERYGFAPSSPGVFKDQPESYQQLGGNNGVKLSLEATGFTDFVPRQNQFKSPQSSPQYSTGSDSPNSSPFGSSGFDHESPPVSGTYNGGNSGYLLSNGNSGYSPSNKGLSYSSDHGGPNYSSDHDDSGYSLGGSYDYPKPQQPIIHKSVYVHVAPPDDEPPRRPRVIVSKSPPKKNYQIIFIKAPTPVPPIAPIIVPPPQQEDKTLIYVLHPKQEEPPPIHIPEQPVQKPHKPEVYFIKYKNRHHGDGEHHGDHGHNGNGGYLPEPGSDFGEHSGNYRRYGRDGGEDQSLKSSSSTLDNLGSLEQEIRKSSSSSEHRKTEEQEPQATDDENEVSEIGSKNANSSDYYNNDDASVESSNHRETRVLSTKIMPKGKNGH